MATPGFHNNEISHINLLTIQEVATWAKEIVRSAPKSGTTHFHGYATVSIMRDHRRYVVALHFIEYGEEMAEIVRWLLKRLKSLQFRIPRVLLDKGFCSKMVFKVMDQHKVRFVAPIPGSCADFNS